MIKSYDDILDCMANGRYYRAWRSKYRHDSSSYYSGRHYDTAFLDGIPTRAPFTTGTSLAATQLTDTSAGFMYHGGDVDSSYQKYLIATGIAPNNGPNSWYICDYLMYYRNISWNSASTQTLTNPVSLPRYTSGVGVRMFIVVTTSVGAVGHTISVSYTNQDGVSGRVAPVTVAGVAGASIIQIVHSGTSAGNYGPFIPLAAGDTGIRSVQSVKLSVASGAGVCCLVLCRPLLAYTQGTLGYYPTDKTLLNDMPPMPRIYDKAYIGVVQNAYSQSYRVSPLEYYDFVWN